MTQHQSNVGLMPCCCCRTRALNSFQLSRSTSKDEAIRFWLTIGVVIARLNSADDRGSKGGSNCSEINYKLKCVTKQVETGFENFTVFGPSEELILVEHEEEFQYHSQPTWNMFWLPLGRVHQDVKSHRKLNLVFKSSVHRRRRHISLCVFRFPKSLFFPCFAVFN